MDTSLRPDTSVVAAVVPPVGQIQCDPFAFIDLARHGRTDWWSAAKGLAKIVGWYVIVGVVLAAVIGALAGAIPLHFIELGLVAGATAAIWLGAYGAVRSQRRPLLSLVSRTLQFSPMRVLLGMALWIGSAVVLEGLSLLYDLSDDPVASVVDATRWDWPQNTGLMLTGLAFLALFPFQAAGEELIFRGWLTQTLGQFLRRRWVLVLLVALVFALLHGFSRGVFAFPCYVVLSLGLSALTLMDGRLELAIGVHAANNINYVLGRVFSSPSHALIVFDDSVTPWYGVALAAVQLAIIYGSARYSCAAARGQSHSRR